MATNESQTLTAALGGSRTACSRITSLSGAGVRYESRCPPLLSHLIHRTYQLPGWICCHSGPAVRQRRDQGHQDRVLVDGWDRICHIREGPGAGSKYSRKSGAGSAGDPQQLQPRAMDDHLHKSERTALGRGGVSQVRSHLVFGAAYLCLTADLPDG